MKTIAKIVAVAMLVAGLSACAAPAAKAPPKVFCPTCGYEFQPPLSGL